MSIVELKIQNTMRTKKRFFYEYLHEQQYIEQKTNEINTVDKAFLSYMEWNLLGAHLFIPLDSLCFFFTVATFISAKRVFQTKIQNPYEKKSSQICWQPLDFFLPCKRTYFDRYIYINAIALRCIVWRYFLVFMSFLFV